LILYTNPAPGGQHARAILARRVKAVAFTWPRIAGSQDARAEIPHQAD